MNEVRPFEEDRREATANPEDFRLDLDGYEGPIDVLLQLAREQKVDLTRISILDLAEQYLAFIAAARRLSLEIAAEYLVMAAWLVYLKSRLLLPAEEIDEEGPSGPELAEALTFQLRRLQAMQEWGRRLMTRPRLGQDVFAHGSPEGFSVVQTQVYQVSLYDLLSAYGENRRRRTTSVLTIEPMALHSIAEAVERLTGLIGRDIDWRTLAAFLPPELGTGVVLRSAIATTFAASLELARAGRLELRQSTAFGPLFLRPRQRRAPSVPES